MFSDIWPDPSMFFEKVKSLPGKMYTFDSGTPISGLESSNFIPKLQKYTFYQAKMCTLGMLDLQNKAKVYILLGKITFLDFQQAAKKCIPFERCFR